MKKPKDTTPKRKQAPKKARRRRQAQPETPPQPCFGYLRIPRNVRVVDTGLVINEFDDEGWTEKK